MVGKELLLRRNGNWRYIIDKAKSQKEKDSNYGYFRIEHFLKKGGNFKEMMKCFNLKLNIQNNFSIFLTWDMFHFS